jgi:DNA-binding Lrp family transcriptional regulator
MSSTMPLTKPLSLLQQQLINQFQKGFPLSAQPYQQLADELGYSEAEVLKAVNELDELDVLSRVGPVFDHKKAGASTLAALAVPTELLDDIAAIVNTFDAVNHNYARSHRYNLWFVVTASTPVTLHQVLADIEQLTGLPLLVLPMEASYHIDLSFNIDFDDKPVGKGALL